MSFFFLKINEDSFYTMPCLQKWLDIVEASGYGYKIVCDNHLLSQKILRGGVTYKGAPVSSDDIIASYKETLTPVLEPILSRNWLPAGVAHLTTFVYAEEHGIENFWNIDADDTSFFSDPETIWNKLYTVQSICLEQNISCASLDMWNSLTLGKHWSFGITFTVMNIDYIFHMISSENKEWFKNYPHVPDYMYNIDQFFTYLRDYKNERMESFYFEKDFFIHWKMVFEGNPYPNTQYWKDGHLHIPCYQLLNRNERNLKVSDNSICIDDSNTIHYEKQKYVRPEIQEPKTESAKNDILHLNNFNKSVHQNTSKKWHCIHLTLQLIRYEAMALIKPSAKEHYLKKIRRVLFGLASSI